MNKSLQVLAVLSASALISGAPTTVQAVPIGIDLTTGGNATINSALFVTTDQRPTGTGIIKPFVRLRADGTEIGINSNEANANLMDDVKAGAWTRDIKVGTIPVIKIGEVSYYQFLLDINQANDSPLLSLDTLKLYTRPTSITDEVKDSLAQVESGTFTQVYNMDGAGDVSVLLDASLNSGSGSGDLLVYIPAIGAVSTSDFLYLYSEFGAYVPPHTIAPAPSYASNGGFEEWGTLGIASVPEGGATIVMFGAALLLLPFARRLVAK